MGNWNAFDRDVSAAFAFGTVPDGQRQLIQTPAPNIIEWCARPEFLNSPSIMEHMGAYQMVRDALELLCPLCKKPGDDLCHYVDHKGDWLTKPRSVLESQPLLVWSESDHDDKCPKCGTTRMELIFDNILKGYNQIHLIGGQRIGKSVAAGAYIATYVEHRLLNMGYGHPGRLQGYFKGLSNDQYEVTLVAASQTMSDETIYGKYKNARRDSPWFRKVIPWIKQQEATQVTPNGMLPWRYNENLTEIEHGYLQLLFSSQNSNSDTQRGRTRIASFLDELCYMGEGNGKFSARQIYIAQENSLVTVRQYADDSVLPPWLGLIVSVSSPKAFDDYGMELLERAKEATRMWSMHRPTWHFNPKQPISKFTDLKIKDPISWQTNFEANPPATSSPLIHDWPRWRKHVEDLTLEPTATFENRLDEFDDLQLIGVKLTHAEYVLPEDSNGWAPAPRIITLDAGLTFDSFALVAGHREFDNQGDVVTVQDWAHRIVPLPGIEPNYSSVIDVILELHEKQPVVMIRMDRWNSAATVQTLRKLLPGVSIMVESMPDEAMVIAMRDGFSGRLKLLPAGDFDDKAILPEDKSPMGALYHEFQKLQRDPKGKVHNPDKGKVRGRNSDDLARCVGHLHWICQRFDYVENEHDNSREARAKRARAHGPKAGQLVGMAGYSDPYSLNLNKTPPAAARPGAHLAAMGGRALPSNSRTDNLFSAMGIGGRNKGRGSGGGNTPTGRGW